MSLKTISLIAEVEVPVVPNFLRYDSGTLDVADVSDDSLRQVAREWGDALVENAIKRRRNREAMSANTDAPMWGLWKAHLITCADCTAGDVCAEGRGLLGSATPADAPWMGDEKDFLTVLDDDEKDFRAAQQEGWGMIGATIRRAVDEARDDIIVKCGRCGTEHPNSYACPCSEEPLWRES